MDGLVNAVSISHFVISLLLSGGQDFYPLKLVFWVDSSHKYATFDASTETGQVQRRGTKSYSNYLYTPTTWDSR